MKNRVQISSLLFDTARVKRAVFALMASAAMGLGAAQAWAGQAATTTTLTATAGGSAATSVPAKTVITLTATVQAGSTPVSPGKVNFCDVAAKSCSDFDVHFLGSAHVSSAGTALYRFRPGIGSHSYKAVFVGTTANAASTSGDVALTVTGNSPTTTILTSSGGLSAYTVKAEVLGGAPVGSSASGPTGSVSFLDATTGNTNLGTVELQKGTPRLDASIAPLNDSAYVNDYISASAVGDLNGDGIPDIVFAITPPAPSVSIVSYLGNADGTFTPLPSLSDTFGRVDHIAVADLNGDGIPDLVLYGYPFLLDVYLGNGDGTFKKAAVPANNGDDPAIAIGDFNGDGVEDLAVCDVDAGPPYRIEVFPGKGDGTFQAAVDTTLDADCSSIIAEDFNGDGKLDLAVQVYSGYPDYTTRGELLLGAGDGTFKRVNDPVFYSASGNMILGDFNGDGIPDLVLEWEPLDEPPVFQVMLGVGDGTFQSLPSFTVDSVYDVRNFLAGDFNGDGIADLAAAPESGQAFILRGKGNGAFESADYVGSSPFQFGWVSNLVSADFNGDGLQDLAAAAGYGSPIAALFLTELTHTATSQPISLPLSSGMHSITGVYSGDSQYSPSTSPAIELQAPGPVVSLAPFSMDFGTVAYGFQTLPKTVTVANAGPGVLKVTGVQASGGDASAFHASINCPASVAVGAWCVVSVTFTPPAAGSYSSTIQILDNAPGTPQTVPVTGVGGSQITQLPASLSFGDEALGFSTDAKLMSLTNLLPTPLVVGSVQLAGANAASFVYSNSCGTGLAPYKTCAIAVRFVPKALGPATATLTVTDSVNSSPQVIQLSGTGVSNASASLNLSAASIDFGRWSVGSADWEAQTVTVTNTSTNTLNFLLGGIALRGAQASAFKMSHNCGTSVAPGAQCNIRVRFLPLESGPYAATVYLFDNAAGTPQTIALSGAGVADTINTNVSISRGSLDFGTETVGTSTPEQKVTVTITGPNSLNVFGIAILGANASSFTLDYNSCNGTVLFGSPWAGRCTIDVHFNPKAVGAATATLNLFDSATGSPQVVALTGTGQ